ncbi:MAG TPA: hypothetical protein VEW25_06115 [Allosphingosinicella sp.]|nr:hypothetical protein [Allosphingosinicella sp.]
MPKKDWRERLVEEIGINPLLRTAVLGIGVTVLGLTFASMTNTPEKRRELKERMRREREYRRKVKEQDSLRHRLRKEYFELGEGKALYERQAYVTIARGRPYPDARFEVTDRGLGFEARSESAGVRLSLEHDFREAMTSVHMDRRGGPHRNGLGGIGANTLTIVPSSPHPDRDFDGWVEDARLMAGLIAAPGSTCERIMLRRPDHVEINHGLWVEHLRRNPDIAAATGEERLVSAP